jgi:hypothetical protein
MGLISRADDANATVEALLRLATERHQPLRRVPSIHVQAETLPAA